MLIIEEIFSKNRDSSFYHNLPCGIIRCENNSDLSITYMNNGFLKMIEYTEEEIQSIYENSFAKIIYSEDLKTVADEAKKTTDFSNINIEFRVISKSGRLIWVMSKGILLKDMNEYACVLIDITHQKCAMRMLAKKAEHDELTNLYNRVTSQILIENYLKYDATDLKAVLFVLDIDDFKKINDNYGHPYADTILVDIANTLKSNFRITDILCRAGGDELIIFLKDIQSIDVVMDKANDLIQSIAEVSKRRSNGRAVTCSIGGAVYPDDGSTLEELYKKADVALYHSKKEGKARFFLYNKLPYQSKNLSTQTKHTNIDSNNLDKETEGDWLLWYAFNLLYESQDIPNSIQLILSLLGQKTGVDRVYIFEYAEEHTRYRNTFEWCNDGINPEIDNLQSLPIGSIKSIFDKFDETNGLFYCKDIDELHSDPVYNILKPQGITAVLQCELKSGGHRFGMLGFDYCGGKKYWSLKLVDLLTKFSYLISVHLSNYRLKEYAKISSEGKFPSL